MGHDGHDARLTLVRSGITVHYPRVDTGEVIPTLLLVGFVLGRWWWIVVPFAAVAWPALLIAIGIDSGLTFAIEAGFLALANTAVGVAVFQAIRGLVYVATKRS